MPMHEDLMEKMGSMEGRRKGSEPVAVVRSQRLADYIKLMQQRVVEQ
jgi:hypothetical protein